MLPTTAYPSYHSARSKRSNAGTVLSSFRLSDYLNLLRPKLTDALVTPAAQRDLTQCARDIPGETTAFFGFECPLDENQPTADLLFCGTQEEGHVALLATQSQSAGFPEYLLRVPAWQQIRDFCTVWENSHSPLHGKLINCWLEFDVAGSDYPWSPSFFFGLPPLLPGMRAESDLTVREALTQLAPSSLASARGKQLDTVLDRLPETAYAFQIGVMLSRSVEAIRVCIRGMTTEELVPYLERIEWPGNVSDLQAVIQRYGPLCERVDLDIDVGSRIGHKVGLEFSFGRDASTITRMEQFLSCCVEDQLTSSLKADALMGYNGYIKQGLDASRWPKPLVEQARAASAEACNYLLLWIHHIKLVCQQDTPLSGKAYLAVLPAIRNRQSPELS